jgi:hypothetical protein
LRNISEERAEILTDRDPFDEELLASNMVKGK